MPRFPTSQQQYMGRSHQKDLAARKREEVTVVYVKDGERKTVKARRDQVEHLTERMDAAGVKVLSVDGQKGHRSPDGSQIAFYAPDDWHLVIWRAEL